MFFILVFAAIVFISLTVFIINYSYMNAVRKAQIELIGSLNEAAIVVDTKNTIILFNDHAESLTGLTRKDVLGQPIDKVITFLSEKESVPYAIYGDLNNKTKQSFAFKLQKTNGDKSEVLITVSKNPIGNSQQTLVTILDTSKEKQLEEMKVDFVSMAAHELRTPLTAIRGYASLLQMHYATQLDDSAKELLTRLIVSTTNLTNLIDNLLSVSRIERNDLTVEAKPIDLGIIIKDIFNSFQQEARTRKQIFTINVPANLPMVMADPFRIGQVFINLISNGINYTPDGGRVTVNVSVKSDHLEIVVQDSGEGIPKEAMPRLFTKFFRVSGSLEQGSKGSGLGLYITKSIVELHKGKISAESEVGKGTTFTVTLPIATEEQKEQSKQQSSNNAFLTVKNGQGIIIRNSLVQNSTTNTNV